MKWFIFLFSTTIGASYFHLPDNLVAPRQIDTLHVIEIIKMEYQKINAKINTYKKGTKDISGQSSEGGEADAYYAGDDLKMMVIKNYGEVGKMNTEYYLQDGKVFFIYIKRTMYDKPIYEKGSKVSAIEEDRFYFHQGKMIRWIDSSEKIVKPSLEIFKLKELELLSINIF